MRPAELLRRWWRKWGWVDILTLGGGGALALGYFGSRTGSWHDPVQDLWPNIATEVLGVWLSVRLIGGLIERRQRRIAVRDTLAGNGNYLMAVCQRIPPRFYDYELLSLRNELQWFREKKALKAKVLTRALSPGEQKAIERIFARASDLLRLGEQGSQAVGEVKRLRDRHDLWRRESGVSELDGIFDQYLSGTLADHQQIAGAIAAAKDTPPPGLDLDTQKAVSEFVALVEKYLSVRAQYDRLLSQLIGDVAAFRTAAWAEE
jgi:hypothetical protein